MNMSAAMDITNQDLHVDERLQIGLRSKFLPGDRYSWQEQARRDLKVWLVERYRRVRARRKGEGPSSGVSTLSTATCHAAPEPAVVD